MKKLLCKKLGLLLLVVGLSTGTGIAMEKEQVPKQVTEHYLKSMNATFSPDGNEAASGSMEGVITFWKKTPFGMFEKYKVTYPAKKSEFSSIVFNKSSTKVLAVSGSSIKLHDIFVVPGTKLKDLDLPEKFIVFKDPTVGDKAHSGEIVSVKFSPDEKRVISKSLDGETKVWDAETGKLLEYRSP